MKIKYVSLATLIAIMSHATASTALATDIASTLTEPQFNISLQNAAYAFKWGLRGEMSFTAGSSTTNSGWFYYEPQWFSGTNTWHMTLTYDQNAKTITVNGTSDYRDGLLDFQRVSPIDTTGPITLLAIASQFNADGPESVNLENFSLNGITLSEDNVLVDENHTYGGLLFSVSDPITSFGYDMVVGVSNNTVALGPDAIFPGLMTTVVVPASPAPEPSIFAFVGLGVAAWIGHIAIRNKKKAII